MAQKTVLVTGTSEGGIGSALVEAFQRKGYHVFATVRSLQKGAHLSSLPKVELIVLDVTDAQAIAAAVETVKGKTGGQLDVLVNNSGGGQTMPLLDSSLTDVRQLFDLNVFSVLAMIQAFAPLLIASEGAIVNIASIAAVCARPYSGTYHASKAATASMSETLRLELEPLGVRVITAMVGEVKTHFFDNASAPDLPSNSLYKPAIEGIKRMATGGLNVKEEDPDVFADGVVSKVVGGATGQIWKGGQAGTVKFASAFLPSSIMDRMVCRGSDLDKLRR